MSYTMYLDNKTYPENYFDVMLKNYHEAVEHINKNGIPDFISFAYDFGSDTDDDFKTGYDLAYWLVVSASQNLLQFPQNFSFAVHSANPHQRNAIQALLNNFLYFKMMPN